MKRLIVILLIGFSVFWLLLTFTPIRHESLYVPPQKLIEVPPTPDPEENEILCCVAGINIRNTCLKSIVYDQFEIRTSEKPGIRLTGFLAYEKDQRLRMTVHSILGQESDIGSNDDIFWFWSRRMKTPALYWARHEDVHKTRLKTPFRPDWMMASLGLDVIKSGQPQKEGRYYKMLEHTKGTRGKRVMRITLIDPKENRIIGIYLNDYYQLIASTEIKEVYWIDGFPVPKRIVITWHEEDVQIEWKMSSPRINHDIRNTLWEKPYRQHQIDLGNEPTFCPVSFSYFANQQALYASFQSNYVERPFLKQISQ